MLRDQASYPKLPLPPIQKVLLEAFQAQCAIDSEDTGFDEVQIQRAYACHEGARGRAMTCGIFEGHAEQGAALVLCLSEIDDFLAGQIGHGADKLDRAERATLSAVRDCLEKLLDWHFKNGAGALYPLAEWVGLAAPNGRAAA